MLHKRLEHGSVQRTEYERKVRIAFLYHSIIVPFTKCFPILYLTFLPTEVVIIIKPCEGIIIVINSISQNKKTETRKRSNHMSDIIK